MVKKIITKALSQFGLEISRKRSINSYKSYSEYPLYIEFIGVPGVGKTTLLRQLNLAQRGWLSVKNFLQQDTYKLTKQTINELEFYQQVADYRVNSVASSGYNSIHKLKVLHYYYTVLTNDMLIRSFNKNHIIISDEGLFHNFGEGILKLSESDSTAFGKIVLNRAFVYCYSKPEIIARQIVKRSEETGKLLPQHEVATFDELVKKVSESIRNKERIIKILHENNVPVLCVDTSDDLKENGEKVANFIKSVHKPSTI